MRRTKRPSSSARSSSSLRSSPLNPPLRRMPAYWFANQRSTSSSVNRQIGGFHSVNFYAGSSGGIEIGPTPHHQQRLACEPSKKDHASHSKKYRSEACEPEAREALCLAAPNLGVPHKLQLRAILHNVDPLGIEIPIAALFGSDFGAAHELPQFAVHRNDGAGLDVIHQQGDLATASVAACMHGAAA